ncbi:MAG: hypothetical protein M5R36_16760 [Deltaproteobacteria bacterium]|nr:hypothetical protein [Deltaproteobacteria bacterium]
MGSSKVNIRALSGISTDAIELGGFELMEEEACRFHSGAELSAGDVVLIKASFKNPCENEPEADDDARVLFRRRVIPFITRVQRVSRPRKSGDRKVTAVIENITPDDRAFFYEKFFSSDPEERANLEVEGRRIDYLS